MLSPKEAAKQRRHLDQERTKLVREQAAATLRTLREKLHEAQAERASKLAVVSKECRAHRMAVRERAISRREKVLADLRDTYARERAEAREMCLLRKAEVQQAARDPIERAKGKWEAEKKYQAELRRIEQGHRDRHRAAKRAHADERRSESDDEVRSNIPADYVPLFERVKRTIKGSSRESRTEAFMRYAEQHPNEILGAIEDESDRKVRALVVEHARAERAMRAHARSRKYTPQELAEVPF